MPNTLWKVGIYAKALRQIFGVVFYILSSFFTSAVLASLHKGDCTDETIIICFYGVLPI